MRIGATRFARGMSRMGRLAIASTMTLAGLGCSQSRVDPLTPPEPAVVWPKPPDQPRVRYLGELKGSQDVRPRKDFGEAVGELLYGPNAPTMFLLPYAIAVHDNGQQVAVADTNGRCVHVLDLSERTYRQIAGCPESQVQQDQEPEPFGCPTAVAWVGNELWIADAKRPGLARVELGGASKWVEYDQFVRPSGLAWCSANELCYVSDAGDHAILAFDRTGMLQLRIGSHGNGPGQFNRPSHLACGPDGTLVVSDSLNFRIQRLGPDGEPIAAFGIKSDAAGDLALPKGVAIDAAGQIWVADAQFENVQAFTPSGQLLMALGKEGNGMGEFSLPAGLYIDRQGRLWVADTYNQRVQVFELLSSTSKEQP